MELLRTYSLVLVVLGSIALALSGSGACTEVECPDHHAAGASVFRIVQTDGIFTRAAAGLIAGAVALLSLGVSVLPFARGARSARPTRSLLIAGVPLRV